jgi:6-phosphofructokinase 1
MKRIAVLTSGGDSPGMNAAIRSVVRSAAYYEMDVFGILRGYEGMVNDEFRVLNPSDVSNIIQRGGTILKSARSKSFMAPEGRKIAYNNLKLHGIEGIIAIGGDGTFTGAKVFEGEFGVPIVGIPGTIDNDLYGTDYTLGYDTAVNTVIEAVDKIRDTADSHDRLFFVEVMGRDAGFIALRSGIGVGAEAICIPETPTYIDKLIETLDRGWKRKKTSSIIIVAEGDEAGGAQILADEVKKRYSHYDIRVSILGHMQRGGSPSAIDRMLASRMGLAAVEALRGKVSGVMIGVVNNKILHTPFEKAIKHNVAINQDLLRLADILSA